MNETHLRGVYRQGRKYYTKNRTPGKTFFDESTVKIGKDEYREVSPGQSKLVAGLAKGCQQFGIQQDSVVLYLGASHGYTPSFVSDMLPEGMLYCVEFSPSVARDLVFVCEQRKNMVPILADAAQPARYAWRITAADIVFQDIAQRDQLGIFLKNCRQFLKPGGFGMLAIKARSIDATRKPGEIFKDVRKRLERQQDIVLVDYRELSPYEKDHAFFVVKGLNSQEG